MGRCSHQCIEITLPYVLVLPGVLVHNLFVELEGVLQAIQVILVPAFVLYIHQRLSDLDSLFLVSHGVVGPNRSGEDILIRWVIIAHTLQDTSRFAVQVAFQIEFGEEKTGVTVFLVCLEYEAQFCNRLLYLALVPVCLGLEDPRIRKIFIACECLVQICNRLLRLARPYEEVSHCHIRLCKIRICLQQLA